MQGVAQGNVEELAYVLVFALGCSNECAMGVGSWSTRQLNSTPADGVVCAHLCCNAFVRREQQHRGTANGGAPAWHLHRKQSANRSGWAVDYATSTRAVGCSSELPHTRA